MLSGFFFFLKAYYGQKDLLQNKSILQTLKQIVNRLPPKNKWQNHRSQCSQTTMERQPGFDFPYTSIIANIISH